MWLIILSDQLPIDALVSRYPTNKLIGRSPLQRYGTKPAFTSGREDQKAYLVLAALSHRYPSP